MGAKKKKGGGGGKKKEEKEEEPPPPPPVVKENWVNIDFKLLNWKFMNFQMKFKESTHIFSIKKILQNRHGRMDDLKLCFHAFQEANEIHDEMLTLLDYGLKGHPTDPKELNTDPEIPTVLLFYDFKPTDFSDPVILYNGR